jgi:hypothetical protein
MPFATAVDFGRFKLEKTIDLKEFLGSSITDNSLSSISELSNDTIYEQCNNQCKVSHHLCSSPLPDYKNQQSIVTATTIYYYCIKLNKDAADLKTYLKR